MTHVNFIDAQGTVRTVDTPAGMSVADAALFNAIPGIDADCGCCGACATCHVYVEPEWEPRLPAPDELEAAMLEHAVDRRANSRLSCQLRLTDELDGITVRTPERQYL